MLGNFYGCPNLWGNGKEALDKETGKGEAGDRREGRASSVQSDWVMTQQTRPQYQMIEGRQRTLRSGRGDQQCAKGQADRWVWGKGLKNGDSSLALVGGSCCNPSYSGDRDQEDHSSKPGQIVHKTLSQKNPSHTKKGLAQKKGWLKV
jgi:hypothetical protein